MPLDGSANPIVPDGTPYAGEFYAYEASGGYVMEQGIQTIQLGPYETINKYDVTQAFQVKYDVREFNEKIRLYKDASNIEIIDSSYNPSTLSFPNDTVSLSASEFRLGISKSNILSVGQYSSLYVNFQTMLNTYFGIPQGFSSLFSLKSQVEINNGIFDASAMMHLMNYEALNASGEYVKTMSGSITIKHVNALLRFACQQNPFNNRTTQQPYDGFMEHDLIYVPLGTQITLVASFVNTNPAVNYVAPTAEYLAEFTANSTGDFTNGDYSQTTIFDASAITRVVKAPMLIKLANISTSEIYHPNTQIQANFILTIDGVISPTSDPLENLSVADLQVLNEATAMAIGVNSSELEIISHSVSPTSREFQMGISQNDQLGGELLVNSYRTLGDIYTAVINFNISATLEQINQSEAALLQYTTAGEFINALTDILTTTASRQALVQMITAATAEFDPPSSLSEITDISGMMAEVDVIAG